MEIGILGALEVRADGVVVEVGTRKARVLLAALVLGRNRVVGADALIQAAWPGELPANPRAALQTSIARLRRALGDPDRLETTADGYRLHTAAGEVDSDRFESLVDSGRTALAARDAGAAASRLREALALWRGPFLGDLGDADFALSESTRLSELRMEATVDRTDAELALGRHRELVAELETLTNANPLREDLVLRLALALYRDGRQPEALDRCATFRHRLDESLGLRPSSELLDLEHRMLVQDPDLDHLVPGAVPSPTSHVFAGAGHVPRAVAALRTAPMIGREEQLRAAVDAICGGEPGTKAVVITGEAGVGKTRLMAEVAGELGDRGFHVLLGRCTASPLIPGEALTEIVHEAIDDRADDLRRHLGDSLSELGRLVPDIYLRMPEVEPPATAPADATRYLAAQALASLLDVVAMAGPVLLLVDDVQAADPLTIELLRHVLRRPEAPVAVVMTERDSGPEVDQLLADVGHDATLVRIGLNGLSPEETSALVEREVPGRTSPWLGRVVHQHTGGNPFFTLELARHLAIGGRSQLTFTGDLPPSLLAIVRRRIEELGGAGEAVLRTAALVGAEFDAAIALKACPDPGAARGLADAADASIIQPVPNEPGRYRFAHGVTVSVLRGLLAPGEAERTHAAIAAALAEVATGEPVPHAALAHHWRHAGAAHAHRAATHSEAGALLAFQRRAFEQARSLCTAGLEALDATGARDDQYLRLLLLAVDAAGASADQARTTGLAEAAVDLAHQLGDHEALVRVALGAVPVLPDERWAIVLEDALRLVPSGSDDHLRLQACLASMLAASEPSRADELLGAVRPLAGERTDISLLHRVLAYDVFHGSDVQPQQRIATADAILAHAGDQERSLVVLDAHTFRGTARLELGDRTGAERDFADHARLASVLRSPGALAVDAQRRAMRALLAGRPEEAERHVHEAMLQVSDDRAWVAVYGGQLMAIKEAQGRFDDMLGLLDLQEPADADRPVTRATRAMAQARLGQRTDAQALLDELLGELPVCRRDLFWMIAAVNTADAATTLGDRAAADELSDLLRPYDARVAVFAMSAVCWGAVARFLAPMAHLLGRLDDAVALHEQAMDLHERLDAPSLLVRDLDGLVDVLHQRGRRGDAARARALEQQATESRARWSLPVPSRGADARRPSGISR